MDTFSLLTGIASGAAATLIGQRVYVELRERRAEQRRRLTERIKTLEHILSRRRSENAETLSRFIDRLAAIERRLSEVANLRAADDRRLDHAFERMNRIEAVQHEFDKRIDYAVEQLDRINVIDAVQHELGRSIGDRLAEINGRLEKLEGARNCAAQD